MTADEQLSSSYAEAADRRLRSAPTELIQRELQRRAREVDRLFKRRARLAHALEEVEASIRELEESASLLETDSHARERPPRDVEHDSRKPPRLIMAPVRNSLSLADALVAELEPGERASPSELAKRVRRSGYVTMAKNFLGQVSHALRKDKRLVRVGVGDYTLAETALGTHAQVSMR